MHCNGLSDDEAIGDELADALAGVGVGDFALLVGVEPDLALAAAGDRRGEALLSSQVDPEGNCSLACRTISASIPSQKSSLGSIPSNCSEKPPQYYFP